MATAPNVLLIVADQHCGKVLGHRGHPDVHTPHLDRLAGQGVSFTNAITQSPICGPSRVSFLSGQYCHNHGYYGLGGPNPDGLPNVLGHFRAADYRTAAIGKIHCPEYWVEEASDVYLEVIPACSVGGAPEYEGYLKDRGLLDLRDDVEYPEFGHTGYQTADARPSRLSYEDSPEGWVARQAIAFMTQAARQHQPFFAHISFPHPHQNYAPSPRFWDLYDPERLTLPPTIDHDPVAAGRPPHFCSSVHEFRQKEWLLFEPRNLADGRRRKLRGYLGCVSQVDHAVGELLDCLRRLDLEEDTIVVYISDHGDYAGEHGIMEKAPGICGDPVTRVPMLWRWPGRIAAGHRPEPLAELIDVPVTLAALAHLPAMETADGADLSALLAGEAEEVHRIAVTEGPWSKSVRRGQYRLVHYPRQMFAEQYPDGFGELYDLENDPWEPRNLYFEPDYHPLACELSHELLDWVVTTTRPTTALPPVLFEGPQSVTRYGNTTNPDGKISPERLARLPIRDYL